MIPPVNAISAWFTSVLVEIWHCVPAYDPDAWNDDGDIQDWNNCYNYACDIMTGTDADPGRAHGISLTYALPGMSCRGAEVHNAAVADGLVPIAPGIACGAAMPCSHKVALAIWPGVDYHWFRQDSNGYWSYKPGEQPVTNRSWVDPFHVTGPPITDPRTANRGPYTEFCGFYCVNKKKVKIKRGRPLAASSLVTRGCSALPG